MILIEYVLIHEQVDDDGWGAYIPDLPGVVALGSTRGEVAAGIEEALGGYADLRERVGQLGRRSRVQVALGRSDL